MKYIFTNFGWVSSELIRDATFGASFIYTSTYVFIIIPPLHTTRPVLARFTRHRQNRQCAHCIGADARSINIVITHHARVVHEYMFYKRVIMCFVLLLLLLQKTPPSTPPKTLPCTFHTGVMEKRCSLLAEFILCAHHTLHVNRLHVRKCRMAYIA